MQEYLSRTCSFEDYLRPKSHIGPVANLSSNASQQNQLLNRPIFAWVIAILITLNDVVAIYNLPLPAYPPIAPPQVNIDASYPGANAEVTDSAELISMSFAQLTETTWVIANSRQFFLYTTTTGIFSTCRPTSDIAASGIVRPAIRQAAASSAATRCTNTGSSKRPLSPTRR